MLHDKIMVPQKRNIKLLKTVVEIKNEPWRSTRSASSPDGKTIHPFPLKKIITSRKNYLFSIWTSKNSQGYCGEQSRTGKMEEKRDNLIGLFYLIFIILMINDLNKWSYLPLSSLFILDLVMREILPRTVCFTQFTTLCDCSIKYWIHDRKGYGGLGRGFLQWKKKEHIEHLLAVKIKKTRTGGIFWRECLSMSPCSKDCF